VALPQTRRFNPTFGPEGDTVILDCAGKPLDLSRSRVMGILNVTPDSFSDGGRFFGVEAAVERGLRLRGEGADIIDIGGESTRPGAEAVSEQEEIDRVLPIIEALVPELDVPVSVDTSKAGVMRAAVRAGASMINDVCALTADNALEAAASSGVPVCLMHMQGEPRTMQVAPHYDNVVTDVIGFLGRRLEACAEAGIPRERLLVDPGFGFGKTLEHNLALLAGLAAFGRLGVPVLVGVSRKSMLGAITGRATDERLAASVAAALLAVERGAAIVRVHDVAQTVDALAVLHAVGEQDKNSRSRG
jgi:dihydropteroate synthase